MNKLLELARRLRMLIFRRRFDADLDEEIRLHLELRGNEQLRDRLNPSDAHSAARRQFGNVISLKERARLAWGWDWLDNIAQDLRYGLRMLRKSPGFSAVAILTIALGVGATTAIFSVVDATLLHPLSYPHPEQLVNIQDDLPGIGAPDVGMSVPELWDYQRSGIFQYVSAVGGGDVNLTGASQPERIRFLTINPTCFAVLGVQPQLGHSFDPNDRTPGFNLEAIISDGLWKRAFASTAISTASSASCRPTFMIPVALPKNATRKLGLPPASPPLPRPLPFTAITPFRPVSPVCNRASPSPQRRARSTHSSPISKNNSLPITRRKIAGTSALSR